MKNHYSFTCGLLVICVFLLFGFMIWYDRPLPIDAFMPESDINCIAIYVSKEEYGQRMDREIRQKNLLPNDELFKKCKTEIEALRFRRSPIKDLNYQIGQRLNIGQSKIINEGDYHGGFQIYVESENDAYDCTLILTYCVDEWEIGIPTDEGVQFHKIAISGGQGASQTFWEKWWSLLPIEE